MKQNIKLFFLSVRLDYNQWLSAKAKSTHAKAHSKQKELQSKLVSMTNKVRAK